MDRFDGTMSKSYRPSPYANRTSQFRKMIAQQLYNHGVYLSDEGVVLDEEPVQQGEILDRLKRREIEYPGTPEALFRLKCVWLVKGRHREKPQQLVELLIADFGESKPANRFIPLGRLDGDKWVSPLV